MDWAAFVVMHFVAWTDGLITNCRAIIISVVGVILTILRHLIRIYTCIIIYIWEVVALGGTQTNYNIGGSSLTSGDEV